MTQKKVKKKYVIIASLKGKLIVKLMKRIPGSRLLISSLPGKALRMHVDIARLGDPYQTPRSVASDLGLNCLPWSHM